MRSIISRTVLTLCVMNPVEYTLSANRVFISIRSCRCRRCLRAGSSCDSSQRFCSNTQRVMCDTFHFKQFSIRHDRCAMKVGTDGILLGAWCRECGGETGSGRILDIGTGTGLVALMLAQRNPHATIDAIEIDEAASEQAAENFRGSAWSERLHAIHGCVRDYRAETRYALIASNPPWFRDSLKSASASRNVARHDEELNRIDLLAAVHRLMAPDGRFCTILPTAAGQEFIQLARDSALSCRRSCEVRPTPDKAPSRLLLEFGRTEPGSTPEPESLTVETAIRHDYTEDFRKLTHEFYLRF